MASPLILALGGTRSGKSRFGLAATRRLAGDGRAWFLGTAWAGDPELDDRIARHRAERPADWPTIDVGVDLAAALARTDSSEPVLIDGLTLWLSALLGDDVPDIDPILDGPVADGFAAIAARTDPSWSSVMSRPRDRPDACRCACLPGPGRHRSPAARRHCRRGVPAGRRPSPAIEAWDRAMTDRQGVALRPPSRRSRPSAPLTPRRWPPPQAGLDALTKPPGSLGRLEELAIGLAGITGQPRPSMARRAIVVAAADHGVARRGVSAYPPEVTAQMVANFVRGGAAINVLADAVDASLIVVDVGVAGSIPAVRANGPHGSRLVRASIRAGTADMAEGPAMTRGEALAAIGIGLAVGRGTARRPAWTSSGSGRWASATPPRPPPSPPS